MGGLFSSPLLSGPWRTINWGDNQSALQGVKDYNPQSEGLKLRILLHGPVGAGKSSFINSVQSVLTGKLITLALVDELSHSSFTKEYKTYKIQKGGPEPFYPFVFSETTGLDPKESVLMDDIKLALKGHVKDGYKFNPASRLSEDDKFYNSSPNLNDQVHVLVCVVPADKVSNMSDETVKNIRAIRMEASRLKIPQVAILTKVDEVCPEIKKDLKNVYKSKSLKEKMEQFRANVGIPINCIFPVKNYHSEIDPNDDVDSLILSSLKHIINYGEDTINFHLSRYGRNGQLSPPPSPPPPPPPPPPLLSEPWRTINWGENQRARQGVKDYNPQSEGLKLRILLHGPVGAGKSSFINSIQSVLRGKLSTLALVDELSHSSFTKEYKTYKIQKGGPESFYPFVFSDTAGLEPNESVLVDDLKLALKGHVKDGYKFNPASSLSEDDKFYNSSPNLNDQVHVLVCVVPADKVSDMSDETVKKIRAIRMEASRLEIPQVAILTKVDEFCPEIKKDLKNVYKSKSLKEKMEQFRANVGIPMNCIFPVKNYHSEIDLNNDVNSLILSSLKPIINFGEDAINFHLSLSES